MRHFFAFLSVIFILNFNVFAVPTGHSSYIKNIYPLSGGSVVIVFDEASSACLTASGSVRTYYYITVGQNGMTELGLKNVYSAALMAFTTHKKVWVNFDSDTSGCYINRLWVYNY